MKERDRIMTSEEANAILDDAKLCIETNGLGLYFSRLIRAVQIQVVKASTKECRFAEVKDKPFNENRPCMGNLVVCNNPDAPEGHVSYSSACRPWKCKLYRPTIKREEDELCNHGTAEKRDELPGGTSSP